MRRRRRSTGDDTPDDLLVIGIGGLIVGVVGRALGGPDAPLYVAFGGVLTLAGAALFGILWLDRRWLGDDGA